MKKEGLEDLTLTGYIENKRDSGKRPINLSNESVLKRE